MTVTVAFPDAFISWRHFNHSDNIGDGLNRSDLWITEPESSQMVYLATRWPGDTGILQPRGPWSATFDVIGYGAGMHALHIIDAYNPGPPVNHEGQFQDPAELASMTDLAWRIRWECPWQGSGSADYNDVYTYLWVSGYPDPGTGWTVGHLGVFPEPEEEPE